MTSDIATRTTAHDVVVPDQAPAPVPDTLAKLQEWGQTFQAMAVAAEGLAQSQFVPVAFRGKPADITAAWMKGMELGFSPMAALDAFDVIQGRAAPRAITIDAIVQSKGHETEIVEWTDEKCIMRGRRRGKTAWQTVEWDLKRAADLGLTGKDQWKKQPKTMLRWRATAELGRIVAPDALLGIAHSAEEIRDMEPVEATIVSSSTSPHGRSLRELAEAKRRPATAKTPDPEPITAEQKQWLGDAFESAGIPSAERPKYIAAVIKRTPGGPGDLTSAEADNVLAALEHAAGLAQSGGER